MSTRTRTKTVVDPATVSIAEHPARNPQVEAWIEGHGVTYTFYPDVPLTEFDTQASLNNQARIQQVLNDVQLETYIEAMRRGDMFPAVVAKRNNKGKLVIVDGNHRLQAATVVGITLGVYELDQSTDPNTVLLMTYEANTRHGLPNSIEDRLRHAIFLIENVGATHETASAATNTPRTALARAWGKYKADKRAREVGLRPQDWDALNGSVRTRIASIVIDETFSRMADLARRAKMNAEETEAVVVRLNQTGSIHEQNRILDETAEEFKSRIQAVGSGAFRGRAQGPRQHLSIAIGHLAAAKDKAPDLLRGVAPQEVDELARRANETAAFLMAFVAALESGQIGDKAPTAVFSTQES